MEIELSQNAHPQPQKADGDVKELVSASFTAMGNGQSFNKLLKGVQVLSATPPTITALLTVSEEHTNDGGVLHTGFAAAMADVLTAGTVRITAARQAPVVSVDLTIAIVQPARVGDALLLEAVCLHADRSIALTEAIFRRKSDGQLIAKATQQLAILHYLPLKTKEQKAQTPSAQPSQTEQNGQLQQTNATGRHNRRHGNDSDDGTNLVGRAQQLLAQKGRATNFNRMADNLHVIRAEPFVLEAEGKIGHEHLNEGGTMHGGYVASLVDIVSVCAVEMAAPPNSPSTSLSASISYLLPAKIGEEIVVRAECLKVGRSIAFTETTLRRKEDGAVLAKGKHNISFTRHLDTATAHHRDEGGDN